MTPFDSIIDVFVTKSLKWLYFFFPLIKGQPRYFMRNSYWVIPVMRFLLAIKFYLAFLATEKKLWFLLINFGSYWLANHMYSHRCGGLWGTSPVFLYSHCKTKLYHLQKRNGSLRAILVYLEFFVIPSPWKIIKHLI